MTSYFADTNIFLRFVLKDVPSQAQTAEKYFKHAKQREMRLIFMSETIVEIEYILRTVYKQTRIQISQYLSSLFAAPYIEVRNVENLQKALAIYQHSTIEFIDLLLYFTAQNENAEVLTFDKQLKKFSV